MSLIEVTRTTFEDAVNGLRKTSEHRKDGSGSVGYSYGCGCSHVLVGTIDNDRYGNKVYSLNLPSEAGGEESAYKIVNEELKDTKRLLEAYKFSYEEAGRENELLGQCISYLFTSLCILITWKGQNIMSMVLCKTCEAFLDSDGHPEGFYVKGYEGVYVCPNCVETEGLEYDDE